MPHQVVSLLLKSAAEGRAVRLVRSCAELLVLPKPATLKAIAAGCGRRRAAPPLADLVSLCHMLRPRLPADHYQEVLQACVDAGADKASASARGFEVAGQEDGDGSSDEETKDRRRSSAGGGSGGGGGGSGGRLSGGKQDVKREGSGRGGLHSAAEAALHREREALRTRCSQLTMLLGRKTRTIERLRQEVPQCEDVLATEAAEAEAVEAEAEAEAAAEAEENEQTGEGEGGGGGGGGSSGVAGGGGDFGNDATGEMGARYAEACRVARERQAALRALQERHALLEERSRAMARRLTDAGVDADAIQGSVQAAQAAQAFAELNTKHKPPEGWPRDIKYTNQLLWNEVPDECQFLRDKIADPTSVRRPKRLKIIIIKNRKHPCHGEGGLYAGEDIEKGAFLLDYAGFVSITLGDEHDTNKSSFLLNLFNSEEHMVYIDVDAARAGNEARFLNDFHGVPGIDAPNCQFWPYYDNVTGEKRIGIKTIREVATGQELLVDYGGKYFAADSSDDSDMHESDEEFEVKPKTKKRRLLKGA